jgi:glycosyltransferase involved in cell wall biosynthesis
VIVAKAKVSVAIITYNQESFLRETLDSVVTQLVNFPIEIVIGDDGSTDGTQDIIKDYQERFPKIIVPILNKTNIGAGENYKKVLEACAGEYVAHLDGDDLMLPGKLEAQCQYLDENPTASACCHDMEVFESETGQFIRRYNSRINFKTKTLSELLRQGADFCHSSKMFRRSTVTAEDLRFPTSVVFDWYMHLLHARYGEIHFIDGVFGKYRISSNSVVFSNYKKMELVASDLLKTVDISQAFGTSQSDRNYARSRIYFERSLRALELRQFELFYNFVEQGWQYSDHPSLTSKLLYHGRVFPKMLSFALNLRRNVSRVIDRNRR